jgi:ABC-type transport system involved in cytochrome bd biosynthesis fused ATPase/permease subunit
MYKDIGRKIKALARGIGYILAGITMLVGVIFMFESDNLESGALVLLATALIAGLEIISTWAFYGFGQLIESTQNIENMIKSPTQYRESQLELYTANSSASVYSMEDVGQQTIEVSPKDKELMEQFLQTSRPKD